MKNPRRFSKPSPGTTNRTSCASKETYKRQKGPDKPEPIRTWYNYKSFYLCCSRKVDESIRSPGLVDDLSGAFGLCAPLYHYLLSTLTAAKGPAR